MRTLRLLLLATVALTSRLDAQSDHGASRTVNARTRTDLERARDIVWRAWFAGDSSTLDRVLAGALAAGGEDGGWSDRTEAIGESRQFARDGGKLLDLAFDSTNIVLHGPVAVMTARYTYTIADRDGKRATVRGDAVEIFVLQKGTWTHPFWHLARR